MPNVKVRTKLLAAAAAPILCLSLIACSSDDSSDGGTSTSTSAAQGSTSTSASPSTTEGPAAPQTSGPPATATDGAQVGVNVLPAVGVGTPADFGGGVTALVTSTKQVDVEAVAPGETAGPAVAVTLEVRNDSDAPVDLSLLAVAASYGKDVPAIPNGNDPADPLVGTLAPGAHRSGVYVFRVPKAEADSLVVSVQGSFSSNTLVFEV